MAQSDALAAFGLHSSDDLPRLGETVDVVLAKDAGAVDNDVEDSSAAGSELRIHAELSLQFGRQTGGRRKVVSSRAVGDIEFHGLILGMTGANFQFEPAPHKLRRP